MNFIINSETLLNKLNILQRAIPSKSSMPSLLGIKFEVTKSKLMMTTCNGDISIQCEIEGDDITINEPGNFVIPGKFFIDIIRKINCKNITMFIFDSNLLIIQGERSEFKLNVWTYDDYPDIKFINDRNKTLTPFELDSYSFRMGVKEVIFATAPNEKRPILTGVLIENKEDKLSYIATDSFRLSKKENESNNLPDFKIVIPSKSLKELTGILEDYEGPVTVYIDTIKALFKFKNISFETRLLEGNYPDTSKIIPPAYSVITKFNRDEFLQALDRVSLLSSQDKERNFNIIQFLITNNRTVEISSANSEIGDAKEEIIPIDNIEGAGLKIGFNSKYLCDSIKSLPSSDVTIKFTGEIRPFAVCSDEYPNLIHVILPLKIM